MMEQTNAANVANAAPRLQAVVENFFDSVSHQDVMELIEMMGIEYLGSESHCTSGNHQTRSGTVSTLFTLYHFIAELNAARE